MIRKTFIVEIGTEELPASILYNLINLFYKNFSDKLILHDIKYNQINYFVTPRRLALKVLNIDNSEKIKTILYKGPSLKNAFNQDGTPTKAAICWANQLGIQLNQTNYLRNKKGEWLTYSIQQKQDNIEILLPKIIEESLKIIHLKNLMRWETKKITFFRPIRNIVMMLDDQIIKNKIFNIISTNKLHNHVSCKEKEIYLTHAKEYPLILFKNDGIIADYNIRKNIIKKEIKKIANQINGYVKINNVLLEEITSTVESPKGLLATFDQKYIKYIPIDILIYVIEKQQKCFPIFYRKNILPYFIVISNINTKNNNKIILDYEKVMQARLTDIIFFLNKDDKIKLLDYLPLLKKVLFYKNLGTLYDKTMRLKLLVNLISVQDNKIDLIIAATLSKCDLITDMVFEFPELQGIIGMYYAIKNQEKYEIALSIKEQYLPSFSGDKLPSSITGSVLSIADKIDTLCGMFLINHIPLPNKDPFALRRAALGVIRIIIENKISIDLSILILNNLQLYNKKMLDYTLVSKKIIKFFELRLLSFYEKKGLNLQIIQSILSCSITDILDIDNRIQAISYFKTTEDFKFIILIIKRISNILKIYRNQMYSNTINLKLMQKVEEKQLFQTINIFKYDTKTLFIERKYEIILSKLKIFENPINNFFHKVKINHSNPQVKNNRLLLLKKVEKNFFKIANFSYLY